MPASAGDFATAPLMSPRTLTLIAACVVALSPAAPLAAQVTSPADSLAPGVQRIVGTLVDDERLAPVAGARITALLMEGPDDSGDGIVAARATTDDAGGFTLPLDHGGFYRLQAQALGYAPTTTQIVEVADGRILTVDFRILPEAILMRPLLVTARRGSGEELFYKRMEEWGQGVFMTPDMIDSIAPRVHPAEVFRDRQDTWLSWSGGNRFGAPIPNLRSFRGQGCLGVMVDRIPVVRRPGDLGTIWENYPLDTLLPKDIEAVEYYRFVGEAPPELRRFARPPDPSNPRQCGLVVFWTKGGW